jgi:hypothetical protein
MSSARSEPANGLAMLHGRIASMVGEAVSRMLAPKLRHEPIPMHLGDNRGGGDRIEAGVALGERGLRQREIRDRTSVHQHVTWHHGQCRDGPAHRLEARAIDVDLVDLRDARHADADCERDATDPPVDPFSGRAAEDLRIVDPIDERLGRKDHCGRHDGAGKRAHADLVDPRHRHDSQLLEQPLVRPQVLEPAPLGGFLASPRNGGTVRHLPREPLLFHLQLLRAVGTLAQLAFASNENQRSSVAVGFIFPMRDGAPARPSHPPTAPATAAQGRSSITVEGGDGATCERAVVIKGADNEFDGVASEYRWHSEHHPGWDLIEQSLVQSASWSYDVLDFRTVDGQTRRACFDIGDFYQP